MLQTILRQFRSAHSDIEFVVNQWFGPYSDRARYGLLTMLPEARLGRSTLVTGLMSRTMRNTYGLVSPQDVSAVLDSSGFLYGDQWGIENVRAAADQYSINQSRGIPTVLLPQSFGPFTGLEMRRQARRLFEAVPLAFAREQVSLNHIRDLGVTGDQIQLAPDFTGLVSGILPSGFSLPEKFACIIPNIRMLDQSQPSQSRAYISFLKDAIQAVEQHQMTPCLLFHDVKNDAIVAQELKTLMGRSIQVLSHTCPMVLKGILGKSQMVIGSRFHALVGALSQSVPVISTSWSHKYQELLQEYGMSEFLIQPGEAPGLLAARVAQLADPAEHALLSAKLKQHAAIVRLQSEQTFQCVFSTLGVLPPGSQFMPAGSD